MSQDELIKVRVREIEGDTLTPISIFHRLSGRKKFLLESSLKHEKSGRYSFIGSDPYKEVKGFGAETEIYHFHPEKKEVSPHHIIAVMQEQLRKVSDELPFPFYGGGVGYIGYDVIRQFEKIGLTPEDDLKMPDGHLMFYKKVVIMDHQTQKIHVVILHASGSYTDEEIEQQLNETEKQLTTPSNHEFHVENVKTGTFTSNMTKEEYKEKVELAKEHIKKGDIFQVVLSQRLQANFEGNPFSFYRELRRTNPSPYMFYVDFEDYIVLGASPESLISVKGKEVLTNPIAGTRKRGATKAEDLALEQDLLSDEKELAEHRMLVDLGRNDLGRVCEIGSIELTKYMKIERYKHVMHIVSEVKGTLNSSVNGVEALAACLPAGTVSGAPKIRAMQIINDFEKTKRGVYSGAVGYININGDYDFALAIRTMVIKNGTAYVQAGAGVVLDSVPQNEFEETINKAKALLEVKA
ncbi:anthranilate synthase component 1 [Salirhabdus euzebyi]|uniref:Anthranilate synthase component 1 n=1 Tax=Salirhabdus euzebyi TaxID=394506 RepID=A0A841Q9L8_9BACI|nr:anthranilate synthase component I [Salirhabdus euzebyi]MBB6455118.1 anthranilate synthase component 1 [Salirhabdus euzebyi]